MLLELNQIQRRLDELFIPLEPMLTGLRLFPSNLTLDEIRSFEESFNLKLPKHFVSMIQRFDFGTFAIGPTSFGYTGNYVSWLAQNSQAELTVNYSWWGPGTRPASVLLIASFIGNSNNYAVILDCGTGMVSAFVHGEEWTTSIVVAENFELFFRGLGTVFFERNITHERTLLAERTSIEVGSGGSNAFWQCAAE